MSPQSLTSALVRAGMVAAGVLLAWWLVDVLLLMFAGVLIAVLLRAPADWLSARTRLSPNQSIALVLVVLVLAAAGAAFAIAPEFGRQFDEMMAQIPDAWRELSAMLEQHRWGRWLIARVQGAQPEAMQGAGRALSTTFGAVVSLFVIAVVGLWAALQPRVYIDNAIRLFPVDARPRVRALVAECGQVLRRWLVGSLVSMTLVAVATAVGLWALGVPLALVLGLVAGVMVFVPNFGPILSAVPALLLALLQGTQTAIWVAVLYVGVQVVENTVVTPLIQRRAVSLPPALTILAQTAMGVLAGALGVVVAVPLTALGLVLVRRTYVARLEGEAPRP